jgi:hypothetical protein
MKLKRQQSMLRSWSAFVPNIEADKFSGYLRKSGGRCVETSVWQLAGMTESSVKPSFLASGSEPVGGGGRRSRDRDMFT